MTCEDLDSDMPTLEDKIKEYLTGYGLRDCDIERWSKDLTAIALTDIDQYIKSTSFIAKQNTALKAKCNLCYESMAEKSNKAITELQGKLADKDAKLKVEIMTISKCVGEWKKIIADLESKLVIRNGGIMDLEQQILAYKPTDKDRIIKVLKKYIDSGWGYKVIDFKTIANEILKAGE